MRTLHVVAICTLATIANAANAHPDLPLEFGNGHDDGVLGRGETQPLPQIAFHRFHARGNREKVIQESS